MLKTLKNDTIVMISGILFLGMALPYFLPMFELKHMRLFATYFSDFVFILLTIVALKFQLNQASSKKEVAFWNYLTIAYSFWLINECFEFILPSIHQTTIAGIISDCFFLSFYFTIILALEKKPHLQSEITMDSKDNGFDVIGTLAFAFGLLVYFAIIPSNTNQSHYLTWLPSFALYIVVDVYLIIRSYHLVGVCRSKRWRWTYSFISLMATFQGISDIVETLGVLKILTVNLGTSVELMWYPQFIMIVLAARARSYINVDEDTAIIQHQELEEEQRNERRTLYGSPILRYALAFPIIHFGLYALNVLDTASRHSREVFVLIYLLVMGVFAVVHQMRIEKRSRALRRERKTAEEALAYERLLWERLMDNIPDTIYFKDLNSRFTSINKAQARVLKISDPSEAIGKTDFDFFPHEHAKLAFAIEQRVIKTGMPQIGKVEEVIWDDKRKQWFFTSKIPLYDKDGTIVGTMGSSRDITDIITTQQTVKQREEHFRALIEQSSDAICLLNAQGKILFAVPAVTRMFGYKVEEFVGQHAVDFIHTDDAQSYRDLLSNLLRAPNTTDISEFRFRHKDESLCWVEVACKNLIEEPTVKALVVNIRDITERKQAAEALRLQQSYFQQLFDNSPAGIVVLDEHDTILNANSSFEKLFHYTLQEIQGKKINGFIVPDHLRDESEKLSGDSRNRLVVQKESIRKRKDGTLIHVNILGYPIIIDGQLVGIYGIYIDTSEQKQLEDKLRQTQKMESIGTLAGGIAHDFNNILAIILGYSSMLDNYKGNPERFAQYTNAISTAVQRGTGIVKQLLTFARKTEVTIEPLDINKEIAELAKLLNETFPKTVELMTLLESSDPVITADRTQLHQALLNLCVNARDAIMEKGSGGRITIKTRLINNAQLRQRFTDAKEDTYVCISVTDTGTGIDEATKSRIFEPFFTTKAKGKGTGLGLAVAYGTAQNLNGFIDVESTLGIGTTFYLYVPFPQQDISLLTQHVLANNEISGGNETILIVEDEEMLSDFVASLLAGKGYRIYSAHDGEEAVTVFSHHHTEIDLVLSDMGLPKQSGLDAYLQMKAIDANVKTVIASGYLEPDIKAKMEGAGVNEFIHKPYEPRHVLTTIREVLDRNHN